MMPLRSSNDRDGHLRDALRSGGMLLLFVLFVMLTACAAPPKGTMATMTVTPTPKPTSTPMPSPTPWPGLGEVMGVKAGENRSMITEHFSTQFEKMVGGNTVLTETEQTVDALQQEAGKWGLRLVVGQDGEKYVVGFEKGDVVYPYLLSTVGGKALSGWSEANGAWIHYDGQEGDNVMGVSGLPKGFRVVAVVVANPLASEGEWGALRYMVVNQKGEMVALIDPFVGDEGQYESISWNGGWGPQVVSNGKWEADIPALTAFMEAKEGGDLLVDLAMQYPDLQIVVRNREKGIVRVKVGEEMVEGYVRRNSQGVVWVEKRAGGKVVPMVWLDGGRFVTVKRVNEGGGAIYEMGGGKYVETAEGKLVRWEESMVWDEMAGGWVEAVPEMVRQWENRLKQDWNLADEMVSYQEATDEEVVRLAEATGRDKADLGQVWTVRVEMSDGAEGQGQSQEAVFYVTEKGEMYTETGVWVAEERPAGVADGFPAKGHREEKMIEVDEVAVDEDWGRLVVDAEGYVYRWDKERGVVKVPANWWEAVQEVVYQLGEGDVEKGWERVDEMIREYVRELKEEGENPYGVSGGVTSGKDDYRPVQIGTGVCDVGVAEVSLAHLSGYKVGDRAIVMVGGRPWLIGGYGVMPVVAGVEVGGEFHQVGLTPRKPDRNLFVVWVDEKNKYAVEFGGRKALEIALQAWQGQEVGVRIYVGFPAPERYGWREEVNEGWEEEWVGKLEEAIWKEGGVVKANSGEGWTGNLREVLELLVGEAGRRDVGLMPFFLRNINGRDFGKWQEKLKGKGVEIEVEPYEEEDMYGVDGLMRIGEGK